MGYKGGGRGLRGEGKREEEGARGEGALVLMEYKGGNRGLRGKERERRSRRRRRKDTREVQNME